MNGDQTRESEHPLTEAEWDAMGREERAAFICQHKPSADAMAWAESIAPEIDVARAAGTPTKSLEQFKRELQDV